jgi:phytanoyl-CoA hydroxylase
VLRDLWGPNIRFDTSKLNMKSAGFGAAVEWHQDWAFYPHTNDDLAAVGVMMDDMALENGALMIVPGTHRGPVFDHHVEGRFCGPMDPSRGDVDFNEALPLTGRAGSITVHHVRVVHGSAPNTSSTERRLILLQYRAADAWPLLGFPDTLKVYEKLLVSGAGTVPDCNLDAAAGAAAVVDHVLGPVYIVGSRINYPLVPVDPQRLVGSRIMAVMRHVALAGQ